MVYRLKKIKFLSRCECRSTITLQNYTFLVSAQIYSALMLFKYI